VGSEVVGKDAHNMPTAEQLRNRLIEKLKELFQLDQPDLDFGFYRIMHAKAKQVTEFLDKDLLKVVGEAFGEGNEARLAELRKAYEDAIAKAREFGVENPEQSEPVRKAKADLDAAADTSKAEGEVYDHLYRFFERYYDNGDFISRRYYTRETSGKAAPYAIPYSGEEVKLHWTNADQYYIKTAEYFNHFSFDLTKAGEVEAAKGELFGDQDLPESRRVHFQVVEATEGEHSNVKASERTKRYFIIHDKDPIGLDEAGELICRFEFRPDAEKAGRDRTWRDKRNAEAVKTILASLAALAVEDDRAVEYLRLLQTPAPTERQKDRPLLAKYLNRYTARNTMDYFIHKDLGGFLRRELDFYIKNEVMRLDDIDSTDAPRVEQYLSKLKVLRQIASKIIDFLAQLEGFQKRLWLKKKFVVDTNYCITLDRILAIENEETRDWLLEQIIANNAQREEWVRLFAIDEIEGSLLAPEYSEPLAKDFLEANPGLVLDSSFFVSSFRERLLASIQDLDEKVDGILVHSDNFQAMRLLEAPLRARVKCVYIDPPYNTDVSAIPYKNNYRHSSWATMMHDRLEYLRRLLRQNGVLFVSIDKTERAILEYALTSVFGSSNRVEELIWVQNTNDGRSPTYSTNHEYVEVYAKHKPTVEADFRIFRESKPGYSEVSDLIQRLSPDYPPVSKIEAALRHLYRSHRGDFRKAIEAEGLDWRVEKRNDPWKGIYQYKFAEYRDRDGKLVGEKKAREREARICVYRESDWTIMSSESKQSETTRDPNDPNYRFYRPVHPVTGKPVAMPARGWKGTQFIDPKHPDRNSLESLAKDHRIAFGPDETKVPQQKRMLHEVETNVSKSVFTDYSDGEKETTAMFGRTGIFLAPKHTNFVRRLVGQVADRGDYIVDCFGGSGSTADAVIKNNHDEDLQEKFVLAEVNTYFDTVLKPRVLKAAYSRQWKDGKPLSRNGVSICVKTARLESYEDCLNNLALANDPERDKLLKENPELREDFMLRYMLDVETRDSASLLSIDAFSDPKAYKLKVKQPASDEYVWKTVDLLETLNCLIGIRVEHIAAPQTFMAEFERPTDPELPEDQRTRLMIKGKIKQDAEGPWWFRKVEGWVPRDRDNPDNGDREKVLIVWRKLTDDLEKDNLMLDEWFQANRISTRDWEFDTIYVNGSNNLPNLKQEGDTWKVRLIEEDFHRLMWDVEDV